MDIGVLYFSAVKFTPEVSPVCLPRDDEIFDPHNCYVAGFGGIGYGQSLGGEYYIILK